MNRRKLFKTGLVLAGGSVLASATGAQNTTQQANKFKFSNMEAPLKQ